MITVWRRGRRVQALMTGGSIVFFVLASGVVAVLSLWRIVDWPLTSSPFFLGVLAVMAFDQSRESLRAGVLAAELENTRENMRWKWRTSGASPRWARFPARSPTS